MTRITRSLAVLCLAALAAGSMDAASPSPIKNSVKYRDAGAKPATGRSGSAAIQVRALRGQNNTDIEVTTGDFDGATQAGVLDKVQVKIFEPNGNPIVTDNYRKGTLSGGQGTFAYDWPMRGAGVQVQANVSGIDPKRTDVVTVPTVVKLRPDLAIQSIQSPAQAYVGSVVSINAVVLERNGDSGARANCVLKADGVEIDRANGIWVDASDVVTVSFRTVFSTVGQRNLTVELTGVAPGDYDTSNNSASATIGIISPTVPINYIMGVSDMFYDSLVTTHGHAEFQSTDGYNASYSQDFSSTNPTSRHIVTYGTSMSWWHGMTFPATVETRLTVDGTALLGNSFTMDENPNAWGTFSGPNYTNRCGSYQDGWNFYYACHYHYDDGNGGVLDSTMVAGQGHAGTVTYAGYVTGQTTWANGYVDAYTYNYGGTQADGTTLSPMPASLGNNVAVHIGFTDAAAQHYEADDSVQLLPTGDFYADSPESCNSYDYTTSIGRYSGYNCSEQHSHAHGSSNTTYGTVYY